jgi:hypothetical protein
MWAMIRLWQWHMAGWLAIKLNRESRNCGLLPEYERMPRHQYLLRPVSR